MLDFYWEKSQGGSNALHSSYDAKTGAALVADATFERPRGRQTHRRSQLSQALAAFSVFAESGYSNAFTLGKNLTSVVLRGFRAPENQKERPRGIAEYRVYPATNKIEFLGTTLWPEPARYTLRSNARAYLLLKHLNKIMGRYSASGSWSLEIKDAPTEEQAWFMTNVLPVVERTGVVPMGLFEIQDIQRNQTALAPERWTSAEDWLAFLKRPMRWVFPRKTRQWLRIWRVCRGDHRWQWGLIGAWR